MNSWIPLIATIVGALLTAVLGNRLVHFWQQRNWRNQQQFSGLEKEYVALKVLSDEILRACGSRLSAMRELNSALRRGESEKELEKYRVVLGEWNRGIHAYYAQLTFQLDWEYVQKLEYNIHDDFVRAGRVIEREIRQQKNGKIPQHKNLNDAERSLNKIAGYVAGFGRELVRETEERRQEVFYGRRLNYERSDILFLSNFDLIKLLFESDIDRYSVVRSPSDISSPLGRRL